MPLINDETQLTDLLHRVFHQRTDKYWLENIDSRDWQLFFSLISRSNGNMAEKQSVRDEMIRAITVLSYRISGIGLYPEFINAYPELTEYESPFWSRIGKSWNLLSAIKAASKSGPVCRDGATRCITGICDV